MVKKLDAEINKVYFINNYTLVHILSGTGSIEVDFKNYTDWEDKAIYLSKGQYIKFLSDDFVVRLIEFPDQILFHSKDVRVLFKHLIALGYINFNECSECQHYLSNTIFNTENHSIIDISAKQWYWQNPFQANKDEYQLIFDTKDIIDQEYTKKLTTSDLVNVIGSKGYNVQHLIKDKVGISLKTMVTNKKILESKKEIAFTDKSIKEVAYSVGYVDPAYFNRVFTNHVQQNPNEFRANYDFQNRETFLQDIIELIRLHHKTEHQLEFYAQQMNVTVKTLSKKVKDKMNTSLGKLIRHELINSSKHLLNEDLSIQDISFELGFEEVSHFSNFFSHQTGMSPSQFKLQKVQ
jgi:AraC-like DNA-binding protein